MFKHKFKIIFLSLLFILVASSASAANLGDAFDKLLKKTGDDIGYDTSQNSVNLIIQTIIQVALSFLGVIFLILIIYGGMLWMTASGNEEQVKKAQSLLKSAIIGLIVVMSAYSISWFVISTLSEKALEESSGGSESSAIIRLYS